MTATLTRDDVLALRDQAEAGRWDNVAGVRLLREAERVIEPVLRGTARRHRVPVEELTSTALRAAWQALRHYDPAKSPDPWGWVAATARRAAGDAAVIASTGQAVRGRARLAAAIEATRRRLIAELGREPASGEVVAALPQALRQCAARVAADGGFAAFTGVAAPMLTYDEAALDRPAASEQSAHPMPCRWRVELAERLVLELGLSARSVEAALELAADLVGDLVADLGVQDALPRVVDELTHARIGVALTPNLAYHVVDALLSAAVESARTQLAAA